MRFGPKRGNFVFIFENFVKDFGLLVVALAIAWFKKDIGILVDNLAVLIIVFVGPIGRIFQYLFTYYSIYDEKLIVKSGWIVKKELEVPLSTITTVDFTQNILHQIFHVYRLNIDNASNVNPQSTKIKMTFSKEDALQVKEILTSKQGQRVDGLNLYAAGEEKKTEVGKNYLVRTKDILLMGALKSKGIFYLGLVGMMFTAQAYLGQLVDIPSNKLAAFFLYIYNNSNLVLDVFILCVLLLVLGIIGGGIVAYIRFYRFHILDNGESIKIEYGLITQKKFTIHKRKISGFYFNQSLLMKLGKIGTLHVLAIGYGSQGDEEAAEDPIILPMIKEKYLNAIMGEILPEMAEISEYEKPKKSSIKYFFYNLGFVFSVLATVVAGALNKYVGNLWTVGAFLILLSVVSVILQYKNAGIYANSKNVSISRGGFNKSTAFIKTNNIERVSEIAGRFKHRKGVTNISIGYIAPIAQANKVVKNISLEAFEGVKSRLIY